MAGPLNLAVSSASAIWHRALRDTAYYSVMTMLVLVAPKVSTSA